MFKYLTFGAVAALGFASQAQAACTAYPYSFSNGQTADPAQVNLNFACAARTGGATLDSTTFTGATSFPGSTTISSTGQIGVGTSSAISALLQAEKDSASGDASVRIVNATNGTASTARLDLAGGSTGSLSELTIAQYAPSFTGTGFGLTLGGYSIMLENTDSAHGSGLVLGTSANHPVIFGTQNAERMRVTGSGSVGIGTTAPGQNLTINDPTAATVGITTSNPSGYSDLRFINNGASGHMMVMTFGGNTSAFPGEFVFQDATAGQNRMAIDSSGRVGIATTSPSYTLHVNGSVAGTSAYNNLSDARLKKNVRPLADAVSIVEHLQGVRFDWRTPGERKIGKSISLPVGMPQVGFIAQNVKSVLPEAVTVANDRDHTMSVAESKVVPVLVEALKEMKAENDSQVARVNRLQIQVSELQRRAGVRTASN